MHALDCIICVYVCIDIRQQVGDELTPVFCLVLEWQESIKEYNKTFFSVI